MAKISINLLPPELTSTRQEKTKRDLSVKASIAFVIVMVVFTGSVLALRLSQNLSLKQKESTLEGNRKRVATLEKEEGLVVVVKKRLSAISVVRNAESDQAQSFILLNALTPQTVQLFTFNANKSDQVTLSGETASTQALQTFFNNLTDPAINEGKITGVNVDNLNKGQTGRIHFDLIVNVSSQSQTVTQPASTSAPPAKTDI